MRKISIVFALLLPSILWAQEICINSSGNKFAPRCGANVVEVALVTDTNAYAAGDYINDSNVITTLTAAAGKGSLSGEIVDVVVTDEGAEGKNLEIWLFDTNPTASTWTDNAAFTVADADLVNVCCVVPVTQHFSAANNGVSVNQSPNCSCKGATTALYAAIVAREAVTFDAVDAVTLRVTINQD